MKSIAHAQLASKILQDVASEEAAMIARRKDPQQAVMDFTNGRTQDYNACQEFRLKVATAHALTAIALHTTGGEK